MNSASFRYGLLTSRLDQLWFPAAFWLLFAVTGLILNNPGRLTWVARAFLGCALPLTGGIMAAYAVLDDPALELRFASPVTMGRLLLERLGFVFLVQATAALAFQAFTVAFGGSLAVLGDAGAVQLAWFIPGLTLIAAGCLASLAGRRSTAGALTVGLVWIVQVIARGWFAQHEWARYTLVFMGALMPTHPSLPANQAVLLALSSAFLAASWRLLRRQERYL